MLRTQPPLCAAIDDSGAHFDDQRNLSHGFRRGSAWVLQGDLGHRSDGVVSPTRTSNSTDAHYAFDAFAKALAAEKTRGVIPLVSWRSIERK